VCVTCSEFEAKFNLESVPALKRQYQLEYEVHKKKAAKFYDKLNEVTNLAKEKNDVDVLCFDFKQNMPLPHLQTSDVFYMRQLWLYVVSMYSSKTGKSIMYLDEVLMKLYLLLITTYNVF